MRERAILALLSEQTIQRAAQKSGIDESTLRRWLTKDDAFKADYEAARTATFQAGMSRIQVTRAQLDCLWLLARYRLTRDQFERWQHVVDAAVKRIDVSRFTHTDEGFWVALREALIAAGGTEREVELVAASLVRWVVTTADADCCEEVLELIAERLVRSDITIRVGPRVCDTSVEFPDRARVQ